jgi:hypothetical protein
MFLPAFTAVLAAAPYEPAYTYAHRVEACIRGSNIAMYPGKTVLECKVRIFFIFFHYFI